MNQVTLTSKKPFTWTFSKIKNFETCGRRYEVVEVKKEVVEDKSPELERGDALHEAMRARVSSGVELPPEFIYMEPLAERLTRQLHPLQIIQTELKLAMDRNYRPTGYMDRKTWHRAKVDYFRIMPSSKQEGKDIGHIVDYKTGRPKDDFTQLALAAFMVFAHYKNLVQVRSDFAWTEYNDSTHHNFNRSDMPSIMAAVLPRVIKLQDAYNSGVYLPNPCGLCAEYCPVTSCEYWGKRHRR